MKKTFGIYYAMIFWLSIAPVFACQGFNFCCRDLTIELRAGVAPTFWLDRGDFAAVSCAGSSILDLPSPYVPLFHMPKFSVLFGVPWYLGAHIGYALCDEQEVYAELNYRQSHSRTLILNPLIIPSIDILNFTMSAQDSYRIIDSYVGIRFYKRSCFCNNLDLFLGGKIGLVHHLQTNFVFTTASLMTPPATPFVSTSLPLFFSNTVPAIGAHCGLSFDINCDCSLALMVELIANCGPHSNSNIAFQSQSSFVNPTLVPNSFIIGPIGTEIAIPITIGFKYKF